MRLPTLNLKNSWESSGKTVGIFAGQVSLS